VLVFSLDSDVEFEVGIDVPLVGQPRCWHFTKGLERTPEISLATRPYASGGPRLAESPFLDELVTI